MISTTVTARFDDVTLVTWAVPPEVVAPALPRGVTVDAWEGQARLSLVALDVRGLRVFGVPAPWPRMRSFAEVNLRVYARDGARQGVVFVRELVESPLMAFAARAMFGEPMDSAAIDSRVVERDGARVVERRLLKDGARARVLVEVDAAARPPERADDPFLTERAWGFGQDRAGRRVETRMEHPPWEVHPVRRAEVHVDWVGLYGPAWAFLGDAAPCSVVHARGSTIRLRGPLRA